MVLVEHEIGEEERRRRLTADGGGQRSSGEVVERSREHKCGACEGMEERRGSLGAFQRYKEALG
jgi:hypothetical protein